jgi:hypothetical protein
MSIEKYISPFIQSQFPLFYQEEGQTFIEFTKAYYEWLETDGPISGARKLLDYRDIDSTLEDFVFHFKNKYIDSLPENVISDKKLLIKHIIELYRSKGTEASYKLLFKMIFNEDIEIYTPSKEIFKLSDGVWNRPQYIEVSDNPYLMKLIGKEINSSSSFSTAVVENVYIKAVNRKTVNILLLTDKKGDFKYGERIFCEDIPEITKDNSPIIFGSLSSISITNGGINYEVGDLLDVTKSGAGAVARVKATKNKNGQVQFNLVDGGTGFSLDAIVSIDGSSTPIYSITKTNPVVVTTMLEHNLTSGTSIRIDQVDGMTQINTGTYSYFANVINSTAFGVYTNQILTTPLNGTSFVTHQSNTGYIYLNTGGQGASFDIGSLVNKEIIKLNTDIIDDYYNTILDSNVSGFRLSISNKVGTFTAAHNINMGNVNIREVDYISLSTGTLVANGELASNASLGLNNLTVCKTDTSLLFLKGTDINNSNLVSGVTLQCATSGSIIYLNTVFPTYTVNCTATIKTGGVGVDYINCNNQSGGYFVLGETITDQTSLATAKITGIQRVTSWGFPAVAQGDIENLDVQIGDVLTTVEKEIGTIASLRNINPGTGYAENPIVTIIEPLVYRLKITEPNGKYKGFNSYIEAIAGYAKGVVTAVEIVDSGFGYERDQDVDLSNDSNLYSVSGKTVVDSGGIGKGYWDDNKSFISDLMYLQDSDYYQNYSYEILASRMLNTYEKYVKDLVHPSGIKMFGRYVVKNEIVDETQLMLSSFSHS